jgi:methionine-rich copper-binding protein CopC/putative copper export protein
MQQRHVFIIFIALILSLLAYSSSILLFNPVAAQASAYVIGSDPVDGSTIAAVPKEIHIYFNAAISLLSGAHVLVVQQNALVEIGANTGVVSGPDRDELIIPLQQAQKLPQGSYLVRWTAVADADGRTTQGSIGFNVVVSRTGLSGTSILGPGTSNELDSIRALDINHFTNILVVVWELILLASLTLWIGILVMEQFVLADRGRCTELGVHTHKRVYSLQWLCLYGVLFSEVVLFFLRTTDIVENAQSNNSYLLALQGLLLHTNYGRFWLACIVFTLIAMGLLYRTNHARQQHVEPEPIPLVPRSGPLRLTTGQVEEEVTSSTVQTLRPAITRNLAETSASPIVTAEIRYPIVWFLLTGLILLMLVLSRGPAQTFQLHISVIVFDRLNLAAFGIWFGSFAYLSYLILPLFHNKELDHHTETLATVLQRLMPFILAAIGIEFVSTLFLSEAAISQPQQLLNDPYGRTLLVQLVLFVVMLSLSLYTMLYLRPTLKRKILLLPFLHANLPVRRLRQAELQQTRKSLHVTSTVITWLGGGVLLCMALMTFFTPPIHFPDIVYNNQPAASANPTGTQTQQIGDLSVSLQVLPGYSNTANTVVLLINDSKGQPITNAQVRLTTNMQVMDMGTGHAVINGGNPVYATTFAKNAAFNMAGVWVITVEIQQPGQSAVQGTFQVTLS